MPSAKQGMLFDHVPTLDGWRALSVLGVIFSHCITNGIAPNSFAGRMAVHGHNGVNVFFAISGFLICGKLLDELKHHGRIQLRAFYVRRVFRILPALYLYLSVLAVFVVLGWIETERWEFVSTLLFVRNYFPIIQQHEFGAHTSQLWSLAVEEHFYLIWPMVLVFIGPRMRRIGWTALISAIAVFAWRSIDSAEGWLIPFATNTTLKTDTRIDGLLWGCVAAVIYPYVVAWVKNNPWRRTLWIPVCGIVLAAGVAKEMPMISLLRGMVFPALIMSTAIAPDSLLGRFLEIPLLRWMGKISYGVYIWQQLPILPIPIPSSPLLAIQHFPYNLPLIFVFASVSYYLCERPMIRLGRRLAANLSAPAPTEAPVPTAA